MKISFVVIGKNEGRNVDRLINSIIKLMRDIEYKYEIIYVDSNSDDDTEEKLSNYKNITHIKLISNIYTAALCRNIGLYNSCGEYIFFLDGDMEIDNKTNIIDVINLIESNSKYIISGSMPEINYKDNNISSMEEDKFKVTDTLEELTHPGGFFIAKKDFIQSVNGFNQYLKCNEEIELFSKLKKNGAKLYRSKKLICIHHNYRSRENKKINFHRFKNRYYTGMWNALYSVIKNKCYKEYIGFEVGKSFIIQMIRFILIIIITLLAIITKSKFIILSAIVLNLVNFAMKKFKINDFIYYYYYRLLILISIFLIKDTAINYEVVINKKEFI